MEEGGGDLPLRFGTYRLKGDVLRAALIEAWRQGIRKFDTAQLYHNEALVGEVLQQLACEADPAHVSTKYWDSGMSAMDSISAKIKSSITRLRGDSATSVIRVRVLLHHPGGVHAWRVLEDLLERGEVDEIGVCNHNTQALQQLQRTATALPCVNQLEVHPKLPAGELHSLTAYCASVGVPIEAHSVLIRGLSWDQFDDVRDARQTVPEYLVHYALAQPGVVCVCISTTSPVHLRELIGATARRGTDIVEFVCDSDIRLYPWLNIAHEANVFGYENVESIAQQLQQDMFLLNCYDAGGAADGDANLSQRVSRVAYYLPSVRSKHSGLGREVARYMYGDVTCDDLACLAKFHALTKPLRKRVTDFVIADAERQRLESKLGGGSCCVRAKHRQSDELSDAIINPVPMPVEVAPREFLLPFFTYLRSDLPWTGDKEFFRGALFGDGRMDLCKQVVGPTHIEELCASVAGNSHIRHFLLGNNVAFDKHPERAAAMARVMADNTVAIETWYLAGNCIDPEAVETLSAALEHNTVAKALWLKRNPIGPRGALSLQRLITTNSVLSILDLDNCGLLDEGMETLSRARGCTGLRHLYVDANGITTVGAVHFADFITAHRDTLKSVYASINRFGDEGAIAIASAFTGSASLKRLSMGSNRITDAAAPAIVECALSCARLKVLDVGCYKSTFDLGEKPNFLRDPQPWLRVIREHSGLRHLDLLRNAMSVEDARSVVAAAREREAPLNVYASMNNALRDELCSTEGIPSKEEQKALKHPKRVVHIDSMYRNKM